MKNRKIDILGTKYSVEYFESLKSSNEDEWVYGECDSAVQKIKIATHNKEGKPLSNKVLETSLLHEVAHAICNEGQYLGYSNDEPFIEWMARCLHSLIKQKII